ncbi:MAG: malate dehydrogenase, partial [Rikenellaceae bacterium]|nr:malate dehydrogenase [Rikenellaceae bacterium]
EAILNDQQKVVSSCVSLEGEYGQNDICIGVPAVIGRNGIEKILEIKLDDQERELFAKSADAVRKTNDVLQEIGVL